MDDRDAYILNSLWTKHFDRGRILRFRHVTRGRQAACYELLTSEQHEYVAYLFPPAFEPDHLEHVCRLLNQLDKERFSVVPMIASQHGSFVVGGPQGAAMAVGLNTAGRELPLDEWTPHDLSQLALRLAWLHRLALEQSPELPTEPPAAELARVLAHAPEHRSRRLPSLNPAHLDALRAALDSAPPALGWCHGDLQPAALLMDADHQLATIVDWALFHAGDPLEDLIDVFVAWCIAPDGIVNAERGRVLVESYRSLRDLAPDPWPAAVHRWCARRIIDAAHDRRGLPRAFAAYLATPAHLAQALALCATK